LKYNKGKSEWAKMTIGERIRKLRQSKHWNQKDLGEKSGINWTNITRYETNKIKPSIKVLKKFAEAFEISVDKLLYDEDETKPELIIQDKELLKQFVEVEKMSDEDKVMIKRLIQAVIVKNQVCNLARSA
jgi:transcriptional regulator with XRE-family HTH domain